PIMLFCIYAHKSNRFNKITQDKSLYIIVGIVVFILGLCVKIIQIMLAGSTISQLISQMLGGPIVALSYIIFFVLLCEDKTVRKILSPLQNIGDRKSVV